MLKQQNTLLFMICFQVNSNIYR